MKSATLTIVTASKIVVNMATLTSLLLSTYYDNDPSSTL